MKFPLFFCNYPKFSISRDLSVDTSQFGQCLTKHGRSVDQLCHEMDTDIVALFSEVLHRELAQVSEVPRQYRWTKKAPPTTHSDYVQKAMQAIDEFRSTIEWVPFWWVLPRKRLFVTRPIFFSKSIELIFFSEKPTIQRWKKW